MTYDLSGGDIRGPHGIVPFHEARDLAMVLVTEAQSLLNYGRLETARRFTADALELWSAYQQAKHWRRVAGPSMPRVCQISLAYQRENEA